MMRIRLQNVVLGLLIGVAVVYFAVPARASESCPWVTQMQEDEGGSVLTTSTCSEDASQTLMQFFCFDSTLLVEIDLAAGSPTEPLNDSAELAFEAGSASVTVPVQFQEMTAFFAGEVPVSGPLLPLLETGESLLVRDTSDRYPPRRFSLSGSSAALKKLVSACQ